MIGMNKSIVLFVFLFIGTMARSADNETLDSSNESSSSSLSEDGDDGSQIDSDIAEFLKSLNLQNVTDLSSLLSTLGNQNVFEPLAAALTEIMNTSVKHLIDEAKPLQAAIAGLPIAGAFNHFLQDMLNLPAKIINAVFLFFSQVFMILSGLVRLGEPVSVLENIIK